MDHSIVVALFEFNKQRSKLLKWPFFEEQVLFQLPSLALSSFHSGCY